MLVVSDTGPLLHLQEVDSLPLLRCFDRIFVPELVVLECEKYRVDLQGLGSLISVKTGTYELAPALRPLAAGDVLQAAEAQAIAMALAEGAEAVLTDDAAAREAVSNVGLRPIGSLGIVIRACRMNLVTTDRAIAVLERFRDSTLFVRESVLRAAYDALLTLPEVEA